MKTCARCGHVNREEATWCENCQKGLTLGGRLAEPWGKTGIASRITTTWALFTGAGCLLLFLFPPLGILLLLISAFSQSLMKKAVPGVCPHCGKDTGTIRQPHAPREFPCVHCERLIAIDVSSGKTVFVKAPEPITSFSFSPANDSASSASSPTREDHLWDKVDWGPMRGGGQSFRSSKLILTDNDRLEFKVTRKGLTFAIPFLAAGVFLISVALYDTYIAPLASVKSAPGCFFVGLVFAASGSWLLYDFTTPIVFDRRQNIFRRGRRTTPSSEDLRSKGVVVPLDRIRGIQILTEMIRGRSGSYPSHELNLVLDNGNRVHLVDQAGIDEVRRDAETISRFLGIPVLERRANQAV